MSRIAIVMPQMGQSVAEGTIVRWEKNQGEFVQLDEVVVEVETDKGIVGIGESVPAPDPHVTIAAIEMVAKRPEDRYQSMPEVAAALQTVGNALRDVPQTDAPASVWAHGCDLLQSRTRARSATCRAIIDRRRGGQRQHAYTRNASTV